MKHLIYKGKKRPFRNIERSNLISEIACLTANLVLEAMEEPECLCEECEQQIKNEQILMQNN